MQHIPPEKAERNKTMRKLLFLLLVPVMAFAQFRPTDQSKFQAGYHFEEIDGTMIDGRAWPTAMDTTEIINVGGFKTIYVNVMTSDTVTIHIYWAATDDLSYWPPLALVDSLCNQASTAKLKSKDFTSTILGASYARFGFVTSAKAFALSTAGDSLYSATFKLLKE